MTSGSCRPRPLLVLDVDGTVLPYLPSPRAPAPDGFRASRVWGFHVWVPEHLESSLGPLATSFELIWCSDWQDAANSDLAPVFGLQNAPVLRHRQSGAAGWWKLDAVAAYAGARPVVWADDQMTAAARRWAAPRAAPTLLLRPNPARGLSPRQVSLIAGFVRRLAAKPERP